MTIQPISPGQIPFSQEAEEAVLGAALISPTAFGEMAAIIGSKDFYMLRHQYIWDAMAIVNHRDDPIDFITLREQINAAGHLEEIGGPGYLLQLVNNTPTSLNAEIYARLVKAASIRRKLLASAELISRMAMDESKPVAETYLEALQLLDSIEVEGRRRFLSGRLSIGHYDQIISELVERNRRGEMVGYSLPENWVKLSNLISVCYPGHLGVLSGDSGSGKSAMSETVAESFAQQGLKTHYIFTEMTTEEILHRRYARHTGIPFHLLASGQIGDRYRLILKADEQINEWAKNINYDWMPDVPFRELASVMRASAQRGTQVFIVDHFQDLNPEFSKNVSEVRALEAMCVWFKAFAETRNVLVIVASQQNDKGKTKWTSKLTEKADFWLSISRPKLGGLYVYSYNDVEVHSQVGERSPEATVSVKKARFGKTGSVKMLYHGPGFSWLDMSEITRPSLKLVTLDLNQEMQRAGAEKAQ